MPVKMERYSLQYENLSQKFASQVVNYNKQYCSIYLSRIKQMTPLLEEQIAKKWKGAYPICKLHKLSEENYTKCIVIGTLFKDQKLKPSILKQLAEGNQLVPQPILTHFTDQTDELYIEDDLQRYKLAGVLKPQNVVTGITCALLGSDDGKGKFTVDDVVFADFRAQVPCPKFDESAYVVFLSGLDLINSQNFAINLQLLSQWLCGFISDLNGIETSKIIRLIIAGNSMRTAREVHTASISMLSRREESSDTVETAKILDQLLFDLCKIDVDVMPGENDPSNHVLPQKPMHYCMFPKSSAYKSVNHVSNPYNFSLGGLKMLGTSGQPVQDINKFSDQLSPLQALENCLKWSHLAPTAPDTLGCFPYYDTDPFVIEDCPHVFFTGNAAQFETKLAEGPNGQKVRLLTIPQFGSTLEACILNLKDLEVTTVSFKTL